LANDQLAWWQLTDGELKLSLTEPAKDESSLIGQLRVEKGSALNIGSRVTSVFRNRGDLRYKGVIHIYGAPTGKRERDTILDHLKNPEGVRHESRTEKEVLFHS
jgi:hypothetical protein